MSDPTSRRRPLAVALKIAGLALAVIALWRIPGPLFDVLSTGSEPSADRHERSLLVLVILFVAGVVLFGYGIRVSRRSRRPG